MAGQFSGKTIVVTGSGKEKGLGQGILQAFADEGADVIVTDILDAQGQAHADQIGAAYHRLDVARSEDWRAVLSAHPKLDILVNNAGITGFESGELIHDPEHVSLDAWHQVHAVNLDGTLLGCQTAIKAMKSTGQGSIINIASRSGLVGIPGAAAYASSKAAIINHS